MVERLEFELKFKRISIWRTLAAGLVAVILGVIVYRATLGSALADTQLHRASRLAPESPPVLISLALAQVGEAAAAGGDPSAATFDKLHKAAVRAPLQPEPFLVAAAMAERAGQYDKAEALLKQARSRDPRSVASRYLLADVLVRENKMTDGLGEIGVVTRLIPAVTVQLIPALAEYAREPGSREKLTRLLADNPQLRQPLLDSLSADPDNAPLVITLAGSQVGTDTPDTKRWESRLVSGLVQRGEYDRAYALWKELAGLPDDAHPLVFNGNFAHSPAPPPFNWNLGSSSAGVAEPNGTGLRVLFYGRDNAILAKQLLLIPAGKYRFAAPASGQLAQGALSWELSCAGGATLFDSPVAGPQVPTTFDIPASCRAQELTLQASAMDMPQDSDVQIGPVSIERVGG